MPFISIVAFLFFTLLSVYFAFLNPHEVEIHFTQAHSMRLPMVALFFGCVLLGLLIAGFLRWTLSIKTSFRTMKEAGRRRRQDKITRKVRALFEKAENLAVGGNFSKAIPVCEKILELSPNHAGALNRLGNIFREEGNPDRALQLHLTAAQAVPDNLEVLYNLADDYAAKAMHTMEMSTLEKIQKLNPNSPRSLYRLREVHLRTEDWALAGDVQKKLISLLEGSEEKEKERRLLGQYVCNNGMRFFNNGNFDAAIPEFKRAIREDARCLSAYIMLGDACLETGNKKAALKAWKSGYENTRSPACLVRMEKLHRESERAAEMIKFYKEAIRTSRNSDRETLCLLLGALCLEQGNPKEAIQAIEENTDSGKSLLHSLLLADAYREERDEKHSQEAMRHASVQARNAILKFECKQCGGILVQWAASCPACGTSGGITCRSGVQAG